jgi:hypothetical protein
VKASILKRLEALERAVTQQTTPRLSIVEVHTLPDADRDAIWDGDTGVLNRYAPPGPDVQPGTISTVVISVSPACRESWLATQGMSDAERNAYADPRPVLGLGITRVQ